MNNMPLVAPIKKSALKRIRKDIHGRKIPGMSPEFLVEIRKKIDVKKRSDAIRRTYARRSGIKEAPRRRINDYCGVISPEDYQKLLDRK